MTEAGPPHHLGAERAVLGSLLLTPVLTPVIQVDLRLEPQHFYREQYGAVYEAITELHNAGRGVDALTVRQWLIEHSRPIPEDLDELIADAPAMGNVREYARIVKDLALRRDVVREATQLQAEARSGTGDVRELLAKAEQRMLSLDNASAGQLAQLAADEERARLADMQQGVEMIGVKSGFADLDKLTNGWKPGALIVLAARPGMGKSAFVTNLAEHAASKKHAVAVFSLEMTRQEILQRLVASVARVSGNELSRGPIDPKRYDRVESALTQITSWPLFVDDTPDLSVLDARVKAQRLQARHKLDLVIVDYLQIMRTEGRESRTVEVGRITRGLKILAKELDVPVIAVSQLSRQVEGRNDKRPMLADLRDSGSIEQDADTVMLLFREHYYDESADPGLAELHVAKQRNGPQGRVPLTFLGRYPKFENYLDPQSAFATPATPPSTPPPDGWPF